VVRTGHQLAELALERHPHNYEILKLQAGNLELFNDPLFRLPTGYFDDEGYGEMLALIVEKPSKAWTSLEQRRINDFFQRIRDRSLTKGVPMGIPNHAFRARDRAATRDRTGIQFARNRLLSVPSTAHPVPRAQTVDLHRSYTSPSLRQLLKTAS